MSWDVDLPEPDWLRELTSYQQDQARLLELGLWPREIALRERAISSTLVASIASHFTEILAKKKRDNEIDVFPPLSSEDLRYLSQIVVSAILAGSWLQSHRAIEYLDNR
jgi:hypothetical protein